MRDAFDGEALAFRGNRRSGFDHIDAEFVKSFSNPQFFIGGERHARCLLAIAQGRVEELNIVK
jgi:hypothetical protein